MTDILIAETFLVAPVWHFWSAWNRLKYASRAVGQSNIHALRHNLTSPSPPTMPPPATAITTYRHSAHIMCLEACERSRARCFVVVVFFIYYTICDVCDTPFYEQSNHLSIVHMVCASSIKFQNSFKKYWTIYVVCVSVSVCSAGYTYTRNT